MIALISMEICLETTLTCEELDEQLCLILEDGDSGRIDYLDVEFQITEKEK